MTSFLSPIHIVGAGLAGSECAFQLAQRGHSVVLHEMREITMTPAHKTHLFAELVCSNSFGSQTDYSAPGQLKWEAEQLGSIVLKTAKECFVPAGMSLSVDRYLFAEKITQILKSHPLIEIRQELIENFQQIGRPAVIATGPLTHPSLAQAMQEHFGEDFLYFFDAIAPIIHRDSIDFERAWFGDRWGKGNNDYINCPLDRDQYFHLINEIQLARKIEPKDFEKTPYFEGCMPIEVMVERGPETLRFGPLSPKGLTPPFSTNRPYAVVQLRQDNQEGTAYNMVGFQTKMAYPEQIRIFRLIPGLEKAEFLKLGSMHRNLYIHSPLMLNQNLTSRRDPQLYFAGQITGVEGYFESTCMGLLVALFIDRSQRGLDFSFPPRASAMGSLLHAITRADLSSTMRTGSFQPTNINFGLLPERNVSFQTHLQAPRKKISREEKREQQIQCAKISLKSWLQNINVKSI